MDVGSGGTLIVQGAGSSASGGPGYLNMGAGTLIVSNSATATLANFTSSGTITVNNASVTTYASIARVVQSGGAVNIINGGSWDTGVHAFEMGVSGGSGVINIGNGVGTSLLTGALALFGTAFDPFRGFPEMIINSGGVVRPLSTTDSFFIYDRGTATLNGGNIQIVADGELDIADINNNNAEEGLLRGVGIISRFGAGLNFTLTNDGDFRPGDTNATARIGTVALSGGDLVQNSGGATFFDFASSGSNDFLTFTVGGGTATIGGTNVFTILNAYVPQMGDRWDFVLADDITYTANHTCNTLFLDGHVEAIRPPEKTGQPVRRDIWNNPAGNHS